MTAARPFCAAESSARSEPLGATASRVDHWILLEYRGSWAPDAPRESFLAPELARHLTAQADTLPRARLLFVKQTERRLVAGRRLFVGSSRPDAERLVAAELEHDGELLGLDLAAALDGGDARFEPVAHPLFLVCTHGKHDRCCALHGRPLYDTLRLGTDSGHVWQSTHVGGDRFAGNVVVLPHGLYYGRVAPGHVAGLLEATAASRLDLDRYRGRSAYSFPLQAAEHAVRESRALTGIDDLVLLDSTRDGDAAWLVRFRTAAGEVLAVDVAGSRADEPVYLTCAADEPGHPLRYVATVRP